VRDKKNYSRDKKKENRFNLSILVFSYSQLNLNFFTEWNIN